ncbi:LuxR C-terminal-related transcriptional regulator [Weeksella virosa]|uniref:LuxR C-terminal-related transcriptional regulator n=1 Tax=Weeksella virosa TaxID=1014 RepID=UPI0025573710|nr:LuxR C-terminal-related transcriptional regulator [Weeksella virosa]MDK7375487.1 LuxR C-terminal-related transcriptional regulator [Weeksella virosa]
MINQSYYPGMIDSSIEFFFDGTNTLFLTNGCISPISQIPEKIKKIIISEIRKDSKVEHILHNWFPYNQIKQIEEFIKCRFGGLDFQADITESGRLQKGEYWDCPLRGRCSGEGKVCQHIRYNNQIINSTEITLIKLLITDLTNNEISSTMNIPLGTIHLMKKNLYEKLEITTKQELALIAVEKNIAQPITL